MVQKRRWTDLGELQLQVLRALWTLGQGTVADIQQQFPPDKHPAYTTIQTVLRRMAKAGLVTYEVQPDRSYLFKPAITEADLKQGILEEVQARIFQGKADEMVASLVGQPERQESPPKKSIFDKLLWGAGLLLTLTGFYLWGFLSLNIFYAGAILAHVVIGFAFLLPFSVFLIRCLRALRRREAKLVSFASAAVTALTLCVITGVVLSFTGTTTEFRWLKYIHIGLAAASLLFYGLHVLQRRWQQWTEAGQRPSFWRLAWIALTIAAPIALLVVAHAKTFQTLPTNEIVNPPLPPMTPFDEGDGKNSPFFPSSASTVVEGKRNGFIPSEFFLESKSCGQTGCHPDIYKQWFESAHHFSSFNNQWYRKSVEYMQEVVGTKPSKWCGGCHDPAVLFTEMPGTGKPRMDFPIKGQIFTEEAQAGLGCMSCHAIIHVKDSMGQGGFEREYLGIHKLATTRNPTLKKLHDYLLVLNPEPHKRAMLKPFMRRETAEFCSSCHKVHLDVPVNHYRWLRGFNEYDAWHLSGVSGKGARSFYYPKDGFKKCVDCHMPKVPSNDRGAHRDPDGTTWVHSHRFLAANTALPTANQHKEQLEETKKFLSDGKLTVDIFGIKRLWRGRVAAPYHAVGNGDHAVHFDLAAPLDDDSTFAVRRGEEVRVEVVVRTRKVGHAFPGGVQDAFDVWLELKAVDSKGRVIFWSGELEKDPCHPTYKGPVEKDAHRYHTHIIDGHGNPINKRNAWARRAVIYNRQIPPGAADTVHFRLKIPKDCGDKIKLIAKLNYRKFNWWFTHFSFAGVPKSLNGKGKLYTPDYDDRHFVFTGNTSEVSGKIKAVPDLPIIVVAQDTATLRVTGKLGNLETGGARIPKPEPSLTEADWERLNDYGIGLLLQRDLRGAEAAFKKLTEIAPENPEGYINLARVWIEEGNWQKALKVLDKALMLPPLPPEEQNFAKVHFFYGEALFKANRLDEALSHYYLVTKTFPEDRVVWNRIGRIHYLKREYDRAIKAFRKTLSIDPEDLQAHYNLMLCCVGKKMFKEAAKHRTLFLRFKDNEQEAELRHWYLSKHPEDNNEAQPIHEHGDPQREW